MRSLKIHYLGKVEQRWHYRKHFKRYNIVDVFWESTETQKSEKLNTKKNKVEEKK